MQLETMLVRRLSIGDECLINVSDFDPTIHAPVDEKIKNQPDPVDQPKTEAPRPPRKHR